MTKTFGALTIAAAFVTVNTACSNEDLAIEQRPEADTHAAQSPVYHFCIPASIGESAETRAITIDESSVVKEFANTDKVYVFIKRGEGSSATIAVAHNGTDASTYLTPTNINGSTCTLEGALKFYYDDNGNLTPFVPAVGDEVYLCYNMSNTVEKDAYTFNSAGYDYRRQNGSIDQGADENNGTPYTGEAPTGVSSYDYAEAKMKVTAVAGNETENYTMTMVQLDDETKSNVQFENLQSIFRQRLSFTDKDGALIPTPKLDKLNICFEGDDCCVASYNPFSEYDPYYLIHGLTLEYPFISGDGDLYFALMFNSENKDRRLVLSARDIEGNIYSVTRNSPKNGFKNGKYYYGKTTLKWQKNIAPTVINTNVVPVSSCYSIVEDSFDIEIIGDSEEYYFKLVNNQGGTIHMNNVHAGGSVHEPLNNSFISQVTAEDAKDVNLVLTGDNSIECYSYCGILTYGNIKLSCTGSEATLTVTATSAEYCGISGSNYCADGEFYVDFNECFIEGEMNVSNMLAAPGFKVIRSPRESTDENGDFYVDRYTWTYTVMPAY